eukprot:403371389
MNQAEIIRIQTAPNQSDQDLDMSDSSQEPNSPMRFTLIQGLGSMDQHQEQDHEYISALTFDNDGDSDSISPEGIQYPSLQFLTEFQSHDPEFNFQKTFEIPEKLTCIEWLNHGYKGLNPQLITSNDKVIKLFQIKTEFLQDRQHEKDEAINEEEMSCAQILEQQNTLVLPGLSKNKKPDFLDEGIKLKNQYINGHQFHIHSVSQSFDSEYLLSADDITINLWNIEDHTKSYNIINIKPNNIEDLQEIITHVQFHPTNSQLFAYSSSKGYFNLCDLRQNTDVFSNVKNFITTDEESHKNEFSEIINSCTWISFLDGDQEFQVISRDYLSVKLWDIRMPGSSPFHQYYVNDYLKDKLSQLYQNDCIFDRFDVKISPNGRYISTGGYNDSFQIIDHEGMQHATLKCNNELERFQQNQILRSYSECGKKMSSDIWANQPIKFNHKIMHTSWHPFENRLAIANNSSIFLFSE